MSIRSIKQCKNLQNKTVLVRCDFDVKIKNNKILDDTRLQACIPTIEFLLKKDVKQIILMGYRGRPNGKKVKNLSLEPVARHLKKLLKTKISFVDGIPRPDKSGLRDDIHLLMLENVRFHPREILNCKRRAKELAKLGDVYVMEAFANSHRSESSVDAIQKYLPSYAGLHLEKEIKNLSQKFSKPLIIIIGGAKIETKLPVIKNFLKKAKYILLGGAVANTFLKAQDINVRDSLVDDKYLKSAKLLLKKSKKIILPADARGSKNKILDIGNKTVKEYCAIIKSAKTIIWNGPMGYFEDENFAKGTNLIAKEILKNSKAKILIGGGETIKTLKHLNTKTLKHKNIFISTGGGAMLEFLARKKLPGLKTLIKRR